MAPVCRRCGASGGPGGGGGSRGASMGQGCLRGRPVTTAVRPRKVIRSLDGGGDEHDVTGRRSGALHSPATGHTEGVLSGAFRSFPAVDFGPDILASMQTERRLTSFSHGAGCGCKLGPRRSRRRAGRPLVAASLPADVLVSADTGDDAAVWRLDDGRALVATLDYFTPIVDDPYDWGRIAATNAMSDVYAMGGVALPGAQHRELAGGRPAAGDARARVLQGGTDAAGGGRGRRGRRPLDHRPRAEVRDGGAGVRRPRPHGDRTRPRARATASTSRSRSAWG